MPVRRNSSAEPIIETRSIERGSMNAPHHPRGPEPGSSEALILAHMEGDPRAFPELYRRHNAKLLARLRRTHSRADAEDMAQEIWARVADGRWKDRAAQGEVPCFEAWLNRVAHNAAVSLGRKHTVRRNGACTLVELAVFAGADRVQPILHDPCLAEKLERCLAKLPEQNRVPLVLLAIEGMTYREIAEHLGTTESKITSRIHAARQALRRLLRPVVEDLVAA